MYRKTASRGYWLILGELGVYTGWPKIGTILYTFTLSNINRYSKLFHCQKQGKICDYH